ncbi:DNA-directed RNA polymerase subunit alpha C-terminal domain-containing protein [Macellibacteroides fermentans]|uniref:DNA-directed RNA polymerase subunit alpha C-terminal domain-containing protein n=1 Tax=Macellibacteroides fermentans TaxID=879969 RepID=UPI003B92E724
MNCKKSNKKIDPIRDGLLSGRALKCCRNMGINSINELAEYVKFNYLYQIRNCGHKAILELNDALVKYAHYYIVTENKKSLDVLNKKNDYIPITSCYDKSSEIRVVIPSDIRVQAVNIFDSCVRASNDDIYDCFIHKYKNLNKLLSYCFSDITSFFKFEDKFSVDNILSSWDLSLDILHKIELHISDNFTIRKCNKTIIIFRDRIKLLIKDIERHYSDKKISLLFSRLDSSAVVLVQSEYDRLKRKLSNRTNRVLAKNNIDYKNIIKFCKNIETNLRRHRSSGAMMAIEITDAFSSYQQYIFNLTDLKPELGKLSLLLNDFPFLDEVLAAEIIKFYEKNGYYPFFRLFYLYFQTSYYRNNTICNKAKGITYPIMSYADISYEYGICKTRVRQIVSEFKKRRFPTQITRNFNQNNYSFLAEDYISIQNIYDLINKSEFNSIDTHFSYDSLIGILSICKEVSIVEYNNQKIVVNSQILNSFALKSALAYISNKINKTTGVVLVPMNKLVNKYTLNSSIDASRITSILTFFLTDILGVKLDNKNNLVLKQKPLDIEGELVKILEKNGEPMSFDDLMFKLNSLYSNKYKFTKGNIKRIIVNSNQISSIGKTSTYSLYKWKVCNLTIRGLIHQILSDSDSPLSLDEIVSILKIKGRNTNKKSISSSIKSAGKYNFIRLESGLYGLSTKQYSDSYIEADKSNICK